MREGFGIGEAIEAMRNGRRVARHGWNGKGMWLELQVPDEFSKMTRPYVFLNYPPVREAMRAKRAQQRAARRKALAESFARG